MIRRIPLMFLALSLIALLSHPLFAKPEATIRDVISKLLDARGGAERIRAVGSLKLKGKIILEAGGEYPLTAYLKGPNKLRYEVGRISYNTLFVYDGKAGWRADVPDFISSGAAIESGTPLFGQKPQVLGRRETKDIQEEADFNRFNPGFNFDAVPAGNLQLLPIQKFEGIPCHVLKVTGSDNLDRYYFIEVPTGEVVKIGDKPDVTSNGTLLSDYREVNGVRFPFNIEIQNKGMTIQQTLVEKIEVNPEIQDEMFAFPKEKPKKS